MFILLGYLSLALVQLYQRYQRRRNYSATMLPALRRGSVLVQRGKCIPSGYGRATVNSPWLSGWQSQQERLVLADGHLAISLVSPKQQVDLGQWTSYLELSRAEKGPNSITALLEAGRLGCTDADLHTPSPSVTVNVLKYGCPLAWKTGDPFGVILLCSCDDFLALCDAFGQGQLVLSEDVQLNSILTISTTGKPKSIRGETSEEPIPIKPTDTVLTTPPRPVPPTAPLFVSVTNSSPENNIKRNSAGFDALSTSPVWMKQNKVNSSGGFTPPPSAQSMSPVFVSAAQSSCDSSVDRNSVSFDAMATSQMEQSNINGSSASFNAMSASEMKQTNGAAVSLNKLTMSQTKKEDSVLNGEERYQYMTNETSNLSSLNESHDESVSSRNGNVTNVPADSVVLKESVGLGLSLDEAHGFEDGVHSLSQNNTGWQSSGSNKSKYGCTTATTDLNVSSSGLQQHDDETVQTDMPNTSLQNLNTTSNGSCHNAGFSVDTPMLNLQPSHKKCGTKPVDVASNGSSDTSQLFDNVKASSNSEMSSDNENSSKTTKHGSLGHSGTKPPNVVVYCGKKDSARKFDMIKEGLEQCLNTSAYTLYLLPHEHILTTPWEDNSAALIISHDSLQDGISKKCCDFLLNGGKVISFGSSMEAEFVVRKESKNRAVLTKFNVEEWRGISAVQGRYHYVPSSLKKDNSSLETLVVDAKSGAPLVVRLTLSADCGGGMAIFSQLFLERDPSELAADSKTFSQLKQSCGERLAVLRHFLSLLDLDTSVAPSLPLTPCYLLAHQQCLHKCFLDAIAGRMKEGCVRSRNLTLRFVDAHSSPSALAPTSDTLPVVTDVAADWWKEAGKLQYFEPSVYWRHLTSRVLGRVVMYTDIIPTTMTVFEGIQFALPEDLGVIAIAGRQTRGKGRGGNMWLSPEGCAMFTLPLTLPVDSGLGQHVSLLQHIMSLAVVHSVRSMPGYQDVDLRLKWPNDIYYGKQAKLGGVLVTSTTMGSTLHATVGCGVNVSNSLPTQCINSVIQQHNADQGSNLRPLSTSEVLARIISTLEELVERYQVKGHEDFCQLYYQYWLHSGTRVTLESEGNAEVEICGLDDYGFLRVINKQGQQLSVQPDGNSFDMLHNLITFKRN